MNKLLSKCYLVPMIAFALILTSCDSFLEEDPTQQMTTDNVIVETGSDVEAVVVGPYRTLVDWLSSATDFGNYLPGTLEYPTGKAISEGVHPQVWRYEDNQVTGDLLNNFNNQWQYWYRGVNDANFAIAALESAENAPVEDVNRGLAEVRTLRAWYYFNLVRYFGDVVMITEALESVDDAQQPKTSLKTIYDEVIIPDLEFALATAELEDIPSSDGRVTKHVTRAIAADVYLTVAGYPYQEVATAPETDWTTNGSWSDQTYPVNSSSAIAFLQNAKTHLDVLYGSYSLFPNYSDLNDPANDNSGEAIFQAQFQSGVENNSIVAAVLPATTNISEYGNEYGTMVPSIHYMNSYDPNDLRIQDREMFFYSDNISDQYDASNPPVTFSRGYLYKYYDQEAVKNTSRSGLNWNFYRYADILLMRTEVLWTLDELGQSQPDADIVAGINEVRSRATLPLYTAANLTLKDIMAERAYELVMENKMLWDQRRTRRALVDGNGEFEELEPLMGHSPTDFSYSFGPKHLLSPIPGREMSTNGEMVQNYDYLPR